MPDPTLLWFFSTEGRGAHVEGQRFDPDDAGCISVPENLGPVINRNPEFKYIGRAIGLVPLGIIHVDTYHELLMQRVDAEWRAARLLLWGYHGDDRRQRKPIPYPYSLELRLDWVAGPGREDGGNPHFPGLVYDCDVSAYHLYNRSDFWTELLIAKADFDRLRNMVAALIATGHPADNSGTGSSGVEAPARRHGPKPGATGFTAADNALCLTIDNMVKNGEARSVIAAALVLAENGRVAGVGTPKSRATRLARRYGKWKSTSEMAKG